jgi:hypothetical protein
MTPAELLDCIMNETDLYMVDYHGDASEVLTAQPQFLVLRQTTYTSLVLFPDGTYGIFITDDVVTARLQSPLAPTASAHDPDFLLLASSYCAAALNRPPSISLDNVSGRSTPEGIINDITTTNWGLTADESDLNQSYHPMMMDEKFKHLRRTAMGIDTSNQSVNRMIQNRLEQFKEAEKRKAAQEYNERVGDIERNHRLILEELRQQRLSHASRQHTQEHPRIANEPTQHMSVSIQTPYELSTNLSAMEGSSTTNTNTNLTTRASFSNMVQVEFKGILVNHQELWS